MREESILIMERGSRRSEALDLRRGIPKSQIRASVGDIADTDTVVKSEPVQVMLLHAKADKSGSLPATQLDGTSPLWIVIPAAILAAVHSLFH